MDKPEGNHSSRRYDSRDNRNRNYGQQRSRQKNYYYKDNNYNKNNDRRQYNNNRHSYNNNYHRYQKNQNNQQKQTRTVAKVAVADPQSFIICESPKFVDSNGQRFTLDIKQSQNPPIKNPSRADQLKNQITPIQKLWTSVIKQYLNDSQFVEIYRKGKSLSYGKIQYGKTIINYDEGDKSMNYQNTQTQSKIFSRAYFKIWQILEMDVFKGKELQKVNIGSVAEGPGGFIHALIDYRLKKSPNINDNYYAITLKISDNTRNAKDWSDFRGKSHFNSMRDIGYKIKLSYGQTGNGDLLKSQNIDYFAKQDLKGQKCYLVTGDGGIQCIGDKEFDYQEVFNVKLFLGQIITALKINEVGGKFILKIYDSSFDLTKQLLSLLCVFYKKVKMVKPVTSRPGNSEKYMLCEEFLGMSQSEQEKLKQLLLKWTQIQPNLTYFQNKSFVTNILNFENFSNYSKVLQELERVNNYFLNQQIKKLEEGIQLAQDNDKDIKEIEELLRQKRFKEQMGYAYEWCKKYNIATINNVIIEEPKTKPKQELEKEEKTMEKNKQFC